MRGQIKPAHPTLAKLGQMSMPYDFVSPAEFFRLLYNESEFCDAVGKIMLAAGMLETNLRIYLRARDVEGVRANSTLGRMVTLLKKHQFLSRNGEMHFDDLVMKRNYLAHSLYDLFSSVIDETILPRNELVEMDVQIFAGRAQELAKEFFHFSKLVVSTDPLGTHLL
jgi:hypothetical protein